MSNRSLLILAGIIGVVSLYSVIIGRSEDAAAGAVGLVVGGAIAAIIVGIGFVLRKTTNSRDANADEDR